eukprot:363810-Chlamydomonas_euryale.AAC.5
MLPHTPVRRVRTGGEISRPEEMLEDEYLRRWLRARNWEVDVAARCIVSHAEWRVGMMPNGCIPAVRLRLRVRACMHACVVVLWRWTGGLWWVPSMTRVGREWGTACGTLDM